MTEGSVVDTARDLPIADLVGFVDADVMAIFTEPDYLRYAGPLLEQLHRFDTDTARHCVRTGELGFKLAEQYGWGVEKRKRLVRAALLHDVGKMEVPAVIVKKPGHLTDEEYQLLQAHVPEGVKLLQGVGAHDEAAIARYHHGLQENPIPVGFTLDSIRNEDLRDLIRFINLSDKVDAMRYARSYRRDSLSPGKIHEMLDVQFPPELVESALTFHHSMYEPYTSA